jgi:hypothetical protein
VKPVVQLASVAALFKLFPVKGHSPPARIPRFYNFHARNMVAIDVARLIKPTMRKILEIPNMSMKPPYTG